MRLLLIFLSFFILNSLYSQQEPNTWDNQLFLSNKVAWGKERWKYSTELQVRLIENTQRLDRWYGEGVVSYMPSKNWEIVPDLRISVKPEEIEYRPGFGLLYKNLFKDAQLVHQLKYQLDIDDRANTSHGMRYVLFYNKKTSDHLVLNVVGGGFYSWSPSFSGIQFIRLGGGVNWLADVKHSISFNYFYGATQVSQGNWAHQGSLLVQLTIRINKDYKYMPAYYINF